MAETTEIGWTDSTVNFWWGCTKVSVLCNHCYAETWDKRFAGAHWGPGAPRRKIKSAAALIRKLNRDHDAFFAAHGRRRRVFMHSMSDVFDNEVPDDWRAEALDEAARAVNLDIKILTKRVGNVRKMIPQAWKAEGWPSHISLYISAGTQGEIDRDVPKLLSLATEFKIPLVGISAEPLLEPLDLRKWLSGCYECADQCGWRSATAPDEERCSHCGWQGSDAGEFCPGCSSEIDGAACPLCNANAVTDHPDTPCLGHIITGGESGTGARITPRGAFQSIRDQCAAAGTAYFHKQNGIWVWAPEGLNFDDAVKWVQANYPGSWHVEHHIDGRTAARVGKARAGRLLDGVTHDGEPS